MGRYSSVSFEIVLSDQNVKAQDKNQCKINKRFDMVPDNFEKVSDYKAVPRSKYCRFDDIGIQI